MDEIVQQNSYEFDERFYQKVVDESVFYQPSVTYILGCAYPAEFGLIEWRGDVGNKRAEEILSETSDDGKFVHSCIEELLKGNSITSDSIRSDRSPKRSLKILRCLKSFLDWFEKYKPKTIKTESIVWSDEHGFAGTMDYLCEIDGKTYLIDWKTSKSIRDSHKVQVCAYGLAEKTDYVAILQLGNTTKARYSFKVLEDDERNCYTEEFHATNRLFKTKFPNAKPNQETFPDFFKIKCPEDDSKPQLFVPKNKENKSETQKQEAVGSNESSMG